MKHFPVLPLMAPLALAASLAACADWLDEPPPATATTPPAVTNPAPAPTGQAPQIRQAARPQPPALADLRPERRPHDTTPPRLVGLSEEETLALLGHPAEETQDPPGKTWIYQASSCRLSVQLFPDMSRGGFYALDYSAEGGKEQCLGKVLAEVHKRGSAIDDTGPHPS